MDKFNKKESKQMKLQPYQLKQRQSLPLEAKIMMTKRRIRDWYDHYKGDVYISFSGGKDSTVLLDLVRSMYPDVPAVFCDTGLEYPEIRDFVKTFDNVAWLKPKMPFTQVIEKYGYPVISKMTARKIGDLQTSKSEKMIHQRLYGSEKGMAGKLAEKWKYLADAPFKIDERCCDVMKKRPFYKYETLYVKSGILEASDYDDSKSLVEL